MEEDREQVVSSPTELRSAEERMLGTELVREMVARRERGEGIKRIARELGVDRKTVKRWLKLGTWQPRQPQRRERQLDRFAEFIERRAPEVGFNGVVLYRELQALGFTGGLMQVQLFVRPCREQRRWSELETVRFETGPGEQAQSITASSGSGSARSRRRFICS
jgi:transposase